MEIYKTWIYGAIHIYKNLYLSIITGLWKSNSCCNSIIPWILHRCCVQRWPHIITTYKPQGKAVKFARTDLWIITLPSKTPSQREFCAPSAHLWFLVSMNALQRDRKPTSALLIVALRWKDSLEISWMKQIFWCWAFQKCPFKMRWRDWSILRASSLQFSFLKKVSCRQQQKLSMQKISWVRFAIRENLYGRAAQ